MKKAISVLIVASLALAGCDLLVSPERRVDNASEMIEQGNYREAAIELRRALQKSPENAEARVLMARTALWLGEVAGAEKELKKAIDAGATPESVNLLDTKIKLAKGEFAEVESKLDARPPGIEEWQRLTLLGEAQLGQGKSEQAITTLTAAVSAAPSGPGATEARRVRAESLAASGDSASALTELDLLAKQDPANAKVALSRGLLMMARGDYQDAEKALSQLSSDTSQLDSQDQLIAYTSLAEAQIALSRFEEARKTTDALAKAVPGTPLIPYLRGRLALAKGKPDEAVTALQRATQSAPGFVQAKLMLAVALLQQGSLGQAEAALREVIAAAPENLEARKLLAQAEIRQGRGESASEVLLPVLTADTTDSQILVLAGQAKALEGDQAEGNALLERGLAESKDDPQARLEIAASYLAAGDRTRALETLATVSDEAGGERKRQMQFVVMATGKDREVAKLEIEQLVARNPGDVLLLNMAAGWLAGQGDVALARKYLQQALAADPKSARTYVTLGRLEGSQRRLDEARKAFEAAVAVDPKAGEAYLGLTLLLEAQGDAAAAQRWLERWSEADAKASLPRILLARRAFQVNDPTKARKLLDAALAATPNSAVAEAAVGQVFLEASAFDEALSHYRKASELDGTNALYLVGTAKALLAMNQPQAAREALVRANSLRPNWPVAINMLAALEVSEKRYPAALALAERLKSSPPSAAAGHGLEGDVRLAMGEPQAAAAAYAQSAKLKPTAEAARGEYLARLRAKSADPAEPLRQWLAAHPDDTATRTLLAQHLEQQGDAAGAIAAYEAVVNRDGKSVVALNNLAWQYALRKDPRAEATARKAVALAPKAPAVADTLGWILVNNGKAADGVEYLRTAHDAAKDNAEIKYHLGVALVRTGKAAEGRRLIEEAISAGGSAPWTAEARQLLAEAK